MTTVYIGIKDFLGDNLANATALLKPLAALPVSTNLRLPASILVRDGDSIDLPIGDYHVKIQSNSVAVKGHITVGSVDTSLAALFVETQGCNQPLPSGTPISNILNLQANLDALQTQLNSKADLDDLSIAGQQLASSGLAVGNLSALRAVVRTPDGYVYADPNDETTATQMISLMLTSANSGTVVQPLASGLVSDDSWNWTDNSSIFLGVNGTLTQVAPNTTVSRVLGFPLNSTEFFFNPQEGIL